MRPDQLTSARTGPTRAGWSGAGDDRASQDELAWASASLADALYRASVGGAAMIPLLIIAVVCSTVDGPTRPMLIGVNIAVVVLLLAGLLRAVSPLPLFGALYASFALDLIVSDDQNGPLLAATVWVAAVTTATPVLLRRGRRLWMLFAVTVAGLATTPILAHPPWGIRVAVVYVVSAAAYTVAASTHAAALRTYTEELDREWVIAETAHRRTLAAQQRSRTQAERARTLHDTVLNTLGAVASGGAAVSDTLLVRQRCVQDVHVIEALLGGELDGALGGISLARPDFTVELRGLSRTELDAATARLPASVHAALAAAVGELLRNACEHSGAGRAVVNAAQRDGSLVVSVHDDGRGFVVDEVAGWGLRESVVRRAGEVGIECEIDSGLGAGTTVTLIVAEEAVADVVPQAVTGDLLQVAHALQRRGAWLWTVLVTLAELCTLLVTDRSNSSSYAMVGLVFGLCAVAWWATRAGRLLPSWIAFVATLAVVPAFLLDLAGSGGGSDPLAWQPISLSPLLIMLLTTGRTRVPVWAGMGLLVGVTAVAVSTHPGSAAAVIVPGAVFQAIQFVAWMTFAAFLHRIALDAARARRRAHADQQTIAATEAAELSRERWMLAGVRGALEVLTALASGAASVTDATVRSTCGVEEQSLRQLIMISPELTHLGSWMATALGEARRGGVTLTLRLDEVDAPDAVAARAIGRIVLSAVEALGAGVELTVSYRARDAPRLLLTGPAGFADLVLPAIQDDARIERLRVERIRVQELIDIQLRSG